LRANASEVALLLLGEDAISLSFKAGNFLSPAFCFFLLTFKVFSFEFCSSLSSFGIDT
jgi:hypothetical protein